MPKVILDAIAVTSRDFAQTMRFYELLGFQFAPCEKDARHIEATLPGQSLRLMVDDVELMISLIGEAPHPANHSHFALLCETPKEVDTLFKAVTNAGFQGVSAPWDAFWGQRYASIADPDGYKIDLFAEL